MTTLFATWPHRWYGWFDALEGEGDPFPSFAQLADPSWRPDDLPQILDYLRNAPVCTAGQAGVKPCVFCGEPLRNLGTWRTDGKWVWLNSLAHLVAAHALRLPDAMAEDIRGRAHRPPAEDECDFSGGDDALSALADLLAKKSETP